jgi:hypothetical protein
MPNPYVVRVDRNAFWNQFRSTPEPALMMTRPPLLVEEPLYRARWPESGPYAGQSFPPFAHGEPPEQTPIQQPLPEGAFPNPPSDMPIEGLNGLGAVEVSVFSPLSVIAALASAWHGYKRNGDSPEWAAVWADSGMRLREGAAGSASAPVVRRARKAGSSAPRRDRIPATEHGTEAPPPEEVAASS